MGKIARTVEEQILADGIDGKGTHPACAWDRRCGHVKEPPGVSEQ